MYFWFPLFSDTISYTLYVYVLWRCMADLLLVDLLAVDPPPIAVYEIFEAKRIVVFLFQIRVSTCTGSHPSTNSMVGPERILFYAKARLKWNLLMLVFMI